MAEAKISHKKLVTRRAVLKGQLTRFSTFLDKFEQNPASIASLQARLETFSCLLADFNNIQVEIECLDDAEENAEENVLERENFEEKYFDLVARAKEKLIQNSPSPQTRNSSASIDAQQEDKSRFNVKLPHVDLPKFHGNYEQWTDFHDTFDSLINKNPNLSNIQRFYYLKGCLKEDALQVISSLTISDAKYDEAWTLLINRFQDKKRIINAHLKRIFELPNLSKESYTVLRKFLDDFLIHYRSLENLGEKVENWSTLLIFFITSKFDSINKKEWEIHTAEIDSPTTNDLIKFLTNRCKLLESIKTTQSTNISHTTYQNNVPVKRQADRSGDYKSFSNVATTDINCPLCKGNHFIYQCKTFTNLPVHARYTEAKRLNLCTNCLRTGHSNAECQSGPCRICRKRHNTRLHIERTAGPSAGTQVSGNISDNPRSTRASGTPPSTVRDNPVGNRQINYPVNNSRSNAQNEEQQNFSHCSLNAKCSQQQRNSFVILSTAIIGAYDINKQSILCRTLLDTGSQSNFVTRELVSRLGLKTTKINVPIVGINQTLATITSQVYIKIKSLHTGYSVNLSFLVIDNITGLIPQHSFKISDLKIPDSIQLADSSFNIASSIDMLLGAGVFYDLLCVGQIKLGQGQPVLSKTKLGWIISGQMLENNLSNSNSSCCLVTNFELQNQIERFWTIEEAYPQIKYSREERECEDNYAKGTHRDQSGRFIVQLPLRENYINLGDSMQNAIQRFYYLEKRLNNNRELKQNYCKFMSEYETLGHMTQINPNDIKSTHYFLPHHGVEKSDSLTTKLRVVFDASSKTTTGISLNDTLKVGPNVQNDLFSIMIRFRKHNVVLVGDIAKMYRQILIEPEQRNLQLIVWRENPNTELKFYQLNTVTYGTASASFLATRSINQIAIENAVEFPNESKIIANDFYVDDLLTGAANVTNLLQIQKNVTRLLSQAGFDLRKFSSNSSELLNKILHESDEKIPDIKNYVITDNQGTKTLGISWNPTLDQFEYSSQTRLLNSERCTKRTILSCIAQIFDPLGMLGPIIMQAKLILQRLWQLQLDWDESIPMDLHTSWTRFHKQLSEIHLIPIPRHAILSNFSNIQLHGFSDASERGYGCCVYIRSQNSGGNVQVRLLCAKSRVAPIKAITLPRLELCGALLLAQLTDKVLTAVDMPVDQIFYWTDSSIVLSWLSAAPHTWQTFVRNRVSQVQQISDIKNWHHVTSSNNPADVISRGLSPQENVTSTLWWNGPSYLLNEQTAWPQNTHISNYARNPDHSNFPDFNRKQVSATLTAHIGLSIFENYSSLSKLLAVIAYCMRFANNCRSAIESRKTGLLTHEELSNSRQLLTKLAQHQAFSDDIKCIHKNKCVRPSSKLKSLAPFMDQNSLIRVGGRLRNSHLTFNQRHQILLPAKHPFTRLIIRDYHIRNLHAGSQATLSNIRQIYWPLNGKSVVRSVIHKCISCFKANPRIISQQMGELPASRVTPSRIFSKCAVDYAGPVYIKDGKYRNRRIIKAYICVFVCMATKATHLELVTELSTPMFLNALKRFVARRGLCSDVYSDNGTNFTGANRELLEFNNIIQQEVTQVYLRNQKISWHFIPARSPTFGGLWEAAVKSVKYHLKRILTNIHLTFEEYYTLLTQIEATLNSRPLTPLSSEPDCLDILTPGHFIIGEALNTVPEPDISNAKLNPSARYQHLLQMTQHFWNRWRKEYLHNLQQRSKWRSRLEISSLMGALVLLIEDNVPSLHWPRGRIIAVHPGADGVVRVVRVRTISGVVKRALNRVCILPIDNEER